MSNDLLMKTLLSNSTPLCLPPKTSITLPKPICSIQAAPTQSFAQLPRVTTKEESIPKNNLDHFKTSPMTLEKDCGMIALEHCYARPLNWKPDSSFYQPTKLLFMQQNPTSKKKSTNPLAPHQDCEDSLDVEFLPPGPIELYDKVKAIYLMEECERHVESTKIYQIDDDWEESIIKTSWSPIQHRLYNGMASILNNDQLARLSQVGTHHEPIQRRIAVDKSVKRVRQLFATISWDMRLTQWIHQLLLDHLSTNYLAAYLDILQTLKAKLPSFVDKMMYGPTAMSRIGPTSLENMFQLLKRPWDPCSSYLVQNKPRKLPENPVIIIVPSGPSTSNISQFKRQHKWMNLFANLCTVVAVHTNIGSNSNRLTMINCADQMLTATRAKVQEVKVSYPDRTIILIGFNAGASLALQVAQVENVFCVVCMGFSVLTAEGKRGDPDDSLLELMCPVLFVIGQCSNTSSQEDLEDLRERMRVENGLIVIGSADDNLRVNKKKKRLEGITQNAVDRLIVESVGEFISGLLLSPFPPQIRQSPTQAPSEVPCPKRMKYERARNNSNCSSLESEPPSPTPKIARPVGRPPGSKTKNKLEAKWAAHVAQGILSTPSPNPPSLTQPLSKPPTTSLIHHSLLEPTFPNDNRTKANSSSSQTESSDKDSSIDIISDNSSDKTESAAKLQMMGLNRSILTSGNTVPNILTTPNKVPVSTAPKHSSGIRVLDSIAIPAVNGKLTSSSTPGIDLSKITVLNTGSLSTPKSLPNGNIVLMPDGKIKTICSTVKGTSARPLLLPMLHKSKLSGSQIPQSLKHGVTKYITSKKQLLGRKPPYPSQKPSSITSYTSNLPPPTNLTSQDIMDLPIIFADDNQMLTDNSELQQVDVPETIQPSLPPKLPMSNPVGKFVFLNKQQPLLQSLTAPALKRPTLSVPVRTTANPVKYTKIIISRGLNNETKTTSASNTVAKITHLSPEVSIRRVENAGAPSSSSASELVDLENKLVATAIPKPEYTITIKKDQEYESTIAKLEKSIEVIKRNAMVANFNNKVVLNDDDPDYVPPKGVKLK